MKTVLLWGLVPAALWALLVLVGVDKLEEQLERRRREKRNDKARCFQKKDG